MKTVSWRLAHRDAFAEGKSVFVAPLDFLVDSRCLEISCVPALHEDTKISQVYVRAETDTYVNRLMLADESIIAKCFGISKRCESDQDQLLCEHEVEVRYLLLMTALARGGVMDAATLPLAMFIARTGRQLCDTGLLLPKQRRAVMAADAQRAAAGRLPRRYAVILAESADSSLTDMLFRAPHQKVDYWLQAALLQVSLALASMHSVFPTFRHNDLHASNVLVQRIDTVALRAELGTLLPPDYPLIVEYSLGGRRWQVDLERAPFRCLLWDFSFSSIGAEDAERAGLDRIVPRCTMFGGVVQLSKTMPNQYCDLHKLVDTLRWVLNQGPVWEGVSSATRALLDDVVPPELSWADKDMSNETKAERQLKVTHGSLQHTSPTTLLLWSDTFDSFRIDETDPRLRVRPVYQLAGPLAGSTPASHFKWPSAHSPGLFSSLKTSSADDLTTRTSNATDSGIRSRQDTR